nr:alpha/beta hydrolase [Chloroflexaceae bacterium]
LDMRGRGMSDKPDSLPEAGPAGCYRMADHAADVLGLLDQLGLERARLGGHSFGGLLSLYMAAHFPQRVERLLVLDAAISTAAPRTRELIKPALARLGQHYPTFEAYLELIRQAPYFHSWPWDATVESYYRADVEPTADGGVTPRARPAHIAAAMEGVLAEDWRGIIAAVQQPVLLINATGAYGPPGAPPIVSAEQAQETAGLLPNCRYVHVPGNHMTMLYGAGARQIVAAISAAFATEGTEDTEGFKD